MTTGRAVQVKKLTTVEELRAHAERLGIELPLGPGDPERPDALARAIDVPLGAADPGVAARVGNRFCALPMEGWDGTRDGRPTDLVRRRWRRFGESGAKLIWGGEAVAVRHDGRANPNQLRLGPDTVDDLAGLRRELVGAHERRFDSSQDLLVGLQLTHSGRFARPDGTPAPRVAYRHPLLDRRVGVTSDAPVLDDHELEELVVDFVAAAERAHRAGFDFVDIKHCHGYLGHELLSARERGGGYGGELTGRTRFLEEVVDGIRSETPELGIAVRLSAFDLVPFAPDDEGLGRPEPWDGDYPYAFGGDGTGTGIDLGEPRALCDRLLDLGIHLLCVTAGSPYYNPHVQRPAYFPPSDGYTPPEDPLVGVARQLAVTADLKRHRPELIVVGSGYSYLQEWVPQVGAAVIARGGADLVGLGRMLLAYPELPADTLAGRELDARRICRTFSDCTTAPRNGLVSGCYPLDDHYRDRPDRVEVTRAKRRMVGRPARGVGAALATLILAVVALLAAACGSGDGADGDASAPTSTTAPDAERSESSTTTGGADPDDDGAYADKGRWLCHPELDSDACTQPLVTTEVQPRDGTTATREIQPAEDPPVDCFYLYPTVDHGSPSGVRSVPGEPVAEHALARAGAARFSEVCRVFAPLHRQATAAAENAGDLAALDTAYQDVVAAFDAYLAGWGGNRPLVLIGHGQGADHLTRLLRERFDDDPSMHARLVSAILAGGRHVRVPVGDVVGATFTSIPLCTARDQVGCVIAYNSFQAREPPSVDSPLFSDLPPGTEVACTNPAGLHGAKGQLRDAWFTTFDAHALSPTVGGLPPVDTELVTYPEYFLGECVDFGGGIRYLWIDRTIDPLDARQVGPLAHEPGAAPGLGLHHLDLAIPLGDLVSVVEEQTDALS